MTPARRDAATAAGGGGVGVLLVWVLQLLGVELTPAAAGSLTAMVVACATALGHEGIVGVAHRLWRGVNGHDENEK